MSDDRVAEIAKELDTAFRNLNSLLIRANRAGLQTDIEIQSINNFEHGNVVQFEVTILKVISRL